MKRILIIAAAVVVAGVFGALLGWRLSTDEPRRGGALTLAAPPSTPVVSTEYGNGPVFLNSLAEGYVALPGLSDTFSVPEGARVYVATHGGAVTTNINDAHLFALLEVALFIDGQRVPGFFSRLMLREGYSTAGYDNWSISGHPAFTTGTHTVTVRAKIVEGGDAMVSGSSQANLAQRGALTVMLLEP